MREREKRRNVEKKSENIQPIYLKNDIFKNKHFCSNCGKEINYKGNFCKFCGNKLIQ